MAKFNFKLMAISQLSCFTTKLKTNSDYSFKMRHSALFTHFHEFSCTGALQLNSQNNEDIFGHLIDANINTCVKSREVVTAEILVKFNQVKWNDGDSVILNVLFSDRIKCQERQVCIFLGMSDK